MCFVGWVCTAEGGWSQWVALGICAAVLCAVCDHKKPWGLYKREQSTWTLRQVRVDVHESKWKHPDTLVFPQANTHPYSKKKAGSTYGTWSCTAGRGGSSNPSWFCSRAAWRTPRGCKRAQCRRCQSLECGTWGRNKKTGRAKIRTKVSLSEWERRTAKSLVLFTICHTYMHHRSWHDTDYPLRAISVLLCEAVSGDGPVDGPADPRRLHRLTVLGPPSTLLSNCMWTNDDGCLRSCVLQSTDQQMGEAMHH